MAQKDLFEETAEGVLIIRSRQSGDIAGMMIETKYYDGTPCFTAYLPTPRGFEWFGQGDNQEKELAALRSLLYADCECCGEWPCRCTAEDLERHRAEYAAWVLEIAERDKAEQARGANSNG
jgi:hypothetical protein